MAIRDLLHRWGFNLQARNQYGVHSPFLYAYLTRCLYRKPTFKGPQFWKILKKSLPYFENPPLWLLGSSLELPDESLPFTELIPGLKPEAPRAYILLITNTEPDVQRLLELPLPENTIWIWSSLRNSNQKEIFQEFQRRKEFQLSLEFSHTGLLFIRSGQQKEHFRLRL